MENQHLSSDSKRKLRKKNFQIALLSAFIAFGIFQLGKDCAQYDKRHKVSNTKNAQ